MILESELFWSSESVFNSFVFQSKSYFEKKMLFKTLGFNSKVN